MMEVAGKPFIAHQLALVKRQAITEVVICAGYLGEQIKDFVQNGERFGIEVSYSFDGEKGSSLSVTQMDKMDII